MFLAGTSRRIDVLISFWWSYGSVLTGGQAELEGSKLAPELIWLHQLRFLGWRRELPVFRGVGACIVLLSQAGPDRFTELHFWQNEGGVVRWWSGLFFLWWWPISLSHMTHRRDTHLCACFRPNHFYVFFFLPGLIFAFARRLLLPWHFHWFLKL